MGEKNVISSHLKDKIPFSCFSKRIKLTSCYSKAQTALKKKKKEMYHELHSFSMTLVQASSDKNAHFLKSVFMYHCAYTHGFIWFYSLDLFEFYGYLFCDP